MSHIAALSDPSPPQQQELYVYRVQRTSSASASPLQMWEDAIPIERLVQLTSAPEGPLTEMICAENPNSFFPGTTARPISQAVVPDFR